MSVASYATNHDHTICYRLELLPGQVKLRLWESLAPTMEQVEQPLPYLYVANFTFNTVAEAEAYLRDYLLNNGAFDVPDRNFPREGAIAILPYPTWGSESP
ncbi:MAG: hypothetical protein AAF827_21825 [Cyanobacteria bacterium P01_D01_bin.6]